jgi:hypothetical protein
MTADGCINPKNGKPKYRFKTRATAKRFLRRVRDRDPEAIEGMHPYNCDVCGWFHVGHYPKNPAARAARRARHRTAAESALIDDDEVSDR